jgi:hypothetical protein
MQSRKHVLLFLLCILNFSAFSSNFGKRQVNAEPLNNNIPVIDGLLNDESWQQAQWTCDFVQYMPVENAAPSQKTCFAVFNDENFLYIAIKAYDTAPDSIVRRLSRRDQIDGDYVGVMIDSYLDHRTAFALLVSAAGVKFDASISDDGSRRDLNWDPIWTVRTNIDHEGWTAEMRIPFSQLRFNPSESNTWGFQVERSIFRNNEKVFWQPFSRSAPGWVHQMGLLTGLDQINPRKTFDIIPYVVSSAESFEPVTGNPYATGSRFKQNAGVDGKIGLTNYLTLDFSVNPDFGQVEADPSEVNLTAYESFFTEKRPFFIEGSDLLRFQLSFGGNTESLFYSRRIGRKPQYQPGAGENTFVSLGDFTPILGAAKITGRTPGGLSVGLLHSVTANQYALISQDASETKILAEPFTNYIVTRAIQDFNSGNTIVGIMGTAVNRNLKEDHLQFLHSSAYSSGLDLTHYFGDRTFMLRATGYFSHVKGSREAIDRTQRSPVHYFQRPDATHLTYDPERTSLTGTGGNIQFYKLKGNLQYAAALLAKSPQLELNEIGFLRSTDQLFQVSYIGYSFNKPVGILRSASINLNQMSYWNFNIENVGNAGDLSYNLHFTNNWSLGNGVGYNTSNLSASMLRGGPAFLLAPSANGFLSIRTNNQKALSFSSRISITEGEHKSHNRRDINLGVTYRPTKTLMITLTPSYGINMNNTQYVRTISIAENEPRYIMANLFQRTLATSLRVNYTITPELTLQFWGQPFISTGHFTDFKKVTDPRASDYFNRFSSFTESQITYNPTERLYHINENEEGTLGYSFRNPDFKITEFLGNLVLRWEYKPGSTFFLVWSQTRDHYYQDGFLDVYQDAYDLFSQKAHNVFLLKFTYRFGA